MYRFSFYLIICLCASSVASDRPIYDLSHAEKYFQEFIETYGKKYDDGEYKNRLKAFKENLIDINTRNSDPYEKAEFGITKFSDLSPKEFRSMYLSSPPPSWGQLQKIATETNGLNDHIRNVKYRLIEQLPNASFPVPVPIRYDARNYGFVTAVKDQGKCGSGYVFAALGTLESTYVQYEGRKLTDFSAQQIVDCIKKCGGCESKCSPMAVPYSTPGYQTEATYPYEGKVGKCRFDVNKTTAYIHTFGRFTMDRSPEDTYRLMATGWDQYIQNFTVAIQIDATSLQNYKKGIITKCSFKQYNHAALLVGFNTDLLGTDYWAFKNSWGKDYGEEGYFRVLRDVNACGMTTVENLFMIASKKNP